MKVSVIMPCYNDGQYIDEAIESILAQTYKDIELIVIDDGSEDQKTICALEKINYPHHKVLHTKRAGPAAARNAGIRACTGEYIFPLDADDKIEAEYIEEAVKILDRNPAVGIVYCHADLFGNVSGKWNLPDYNLNCELIDNCIFVSAMFRKVDWESIGGFCEQFHAGMEDYDFWLSIIEMGKEVHQFSDIWFHYRIKSDSRSQLLNQKISNLQEMYQLIFNRHTRLFNQNIDIYCQGLRNQLLQQKMINQLMSESKDNLDIYHASAMLELSTYKDDPLVAYVYSLRRMKPGIAKWLDCLLEIKNKFKQLTIKREK